MDWNAQAGQLPRQGGETITAAAAVAATAAAAAAATRHTQWSTALSLEHDPPVCEQQDVVEEVDHLHSRHSMVGTAGKAWCAEGWQVGGRRRDEEGGWPEWRCQLPTGQPFHLSQHSMDVALLPAHANADGHPCKHIAPLVVAAAER